ncbi:MAG: hypothetical protein ABW105_06420 [Candidatus Thiodiazotropha sp. 6PLUC1]
MRQTIFVMLIIVVDDGIDAPLLRPTPAKGRGELLSLLTYHSDDFCFLLPLILCCMVPSISQHILDMCISSEINQLSQ